MAHLGTEKLPPKCTKSHPNFPKIFRGDTLDPFNKGLANLGSAPDRQGGAGAGTENGGKEKDGEEEKGEGRKKGGKGKGGKRKMEGIASSNKADQSPW